MARFLPVLTETKDERTVLLPSRPLTFEEFVKLFGEDEDVELVDGMVVKRMAAKDPHEDIGGIAMEADYRHIGVAEIWFVDQRRKLVRVLRKRDNRYEERVYRKGVVRSEVVEGFWVRGEWLFQKPLPKELPTLLQILGKA